MLLTTTFAPEAYRRALDAWLWLDPSLTEKTPICASLFGDLFLLDRDGYCFLDSIEGNLDRVCQSRPDFHTILDSEAGQDRYLLGGLAFGAHQRGIQLAPEQVYDFTVPPILGGKLELDNITVMDFVVSLNLAGQLHQQLRDLPPGTPITSFQFKP